MIKLLLLLRWFAREVVTSFNPISASLLMISAILFLLKLRKFWSNKLHLPPSPPKLPFIGNLHQLTGVLHRCFRDMSQKYGPIMFLHLGHSPTLIVSSCSIAREIMKTQDINFANRPRLAAAEALFYGCSDIVFMPYGEFYKQMRKICVQEVLSNSRVQSSKYIREEEVALMTEKISRSCLLQTPVNIAETALTLTNDIICRTALSTKSEDGTNGIIEMAREFSIRFGELCFADLYPSLGWMDVLTGFRSRIRALSQMTDTYLDKVIEEHVDRREEDDSKKDLLDLLLQIQDKNNLTKENIKGIVLDMFLGGTDTTAMTIEWAMSELIKHPDVLKKAQEEVRRIVGMTSKVHEVHIQHMEYLKCVIKETLRLHPPVPMTLPRISITNTKINGYDIPSNTTVMINAWAIQRDPEIWNEPNEFIPERFDISSMDFRGQNYEFIPFGSGRRSCPGISFGISTVEIAMASLLYNYDWTLPVGIHMNDVDMIEGFGMGGNKRIPLHLVPTSYSP